MFMFTIHALGTWTVMHMPSARTALSHAQKLHVYLQQHLFPRYSSYTLHAYVQASVLTTYKLHAYLQELETLFVIPVEVGSGYS